MRSIASRGSARPRSNAVLGYRYLDEVVHRDDLALL